jgi:predicted Zn-dependent peptidase
LENKIETPEEYLKKIESVTKEEIVKVSREIFQENKMFLTVIGPFSDEKNFVKIMAPKKG